MTISTQPTPPTALDLIKDFYQSVGNRIDDIEKDPHASCEVHEYSYKLGAEHAFADSISLLEREKLVAEENTKGSKIPKAVVVVGVAGAVYVGWPHLKVARRKAQVKLNELRQEMKR